MRLRAKYLKKEETKAKDNWTKSRSMMPISKKSSKKD
jgi:hypothetical protein